MTDTKDLKLCQPMPEDAAAVARMHLACWRESYRGLVPDVILDSVDEAAHTSNWQQRIDTVPESIFLAELKGEIVGLTQIAKPRNAYLSALADGELKALYVRKAMLRHGIGRRLVKAAALAWLAHGGKKLSLQVIKENTGARRFYEALGAVYKGDSSHDWHGYSLAVATYLISDLRALTHNDLERF